MSPIETKDVVTMGISGIAVALSLIAFVVSYFRGEKEKQRAVRNQITDTLDKITENMLENAKLQREADSHSTYVQAASGIFAQRNSFLFNQAVYLADLAPNLVTYIDYNTIAWASSNAGELIIAERNYQKAIDACPNDSVRSLAIRSYASFLFSYRRFEEGRDQFQRAASISRGADNFSRYQKGSTYQLWGWCEANNAASPKRAEQAFESAKSEFDGIDNEAIRQNALNGLQAARLSPSPPGPQMAEPTEKSSAQP